MDIAKTAIIPKATIKIILPIFLPMVFEILIPATERTPIKARIMALTIGTMPTEKLANRDRKSVV